MSNPNTLVSLAYIKANDNPLLVFCNYILYVLIVSGEESLREDELVKKLKEKFGLSIPHVMIMNCANILKKNNEITILPMGKGFAIKETDFDVKEFEDNLKRLQAQEDHVLNELIKFVFEKYKLTWTKEEAKRNLSGFLDKEGNGARLFLYEEVEVDNKKVSPSLYVGRYISSVQRLEDSIEKRYLEEIVRGMMIYQGVYQIGDYQQNKTQKFKDTVFYLDTKLILRALGYSWGAQVKAARDLIDLIMNEYEGKIGVFNETLSEVSNALEKAGWNYQRKEEIYNTELKVYAELNPKGASLLLDNAGIVQKRLEEEFGIQVEPNIDWYSEKTKRNCIETTDIIDYIQKEHEKWRTGTIENDVSIINKINIIRNGDYSERYGGKKKLPVFVTTNVDLVHSFKRYVEEIIGEEKYSRWNVHALPIVSDNMILFRMWTPVANKYSDLPAITLARYAYSAQNPNTQYFEKLKKSALEYSKEKGVDLFDLSESRRRKLEDLLIINSKGNADSLTEEIVAISVDELIKMENISLHNEIDNLHSDNDDKDEQLKKQDEYIIELLSKNYVNKIGFWNRLLILVAKFWWIIAWLILYVGLEYLQKQLELKIPLFWIPFVAPGIQLVLFAIDKFVEDKNLRCFIENKAKKFVFNKYVSKIDANLPAGDNRYRDRVVEYCKNHTKIFKGL